MPPYVLFLWPFLFPFWYYNFQLPLCHCLDMSYLIHCVGCSNRLNFRRNAANQNAVHHLWRNWARKYKYTLIVNDNVVEMPSIANIFIHIDTMWTAENVVEMWKRLRKERNTTIQHDLRAHTDFKTYHIYLFVCVSMRMGAFIK